jgi:ubiquinone/menaquinone biosynthesis C-methylase UbiE
MMAGGILGGMKGAAYAAASTAKVGWYTAHYLAARRLTGPLTSPGEVPRPLRARPLDMAEMRRSFLALFDEERRDVEAGIHKLPREFRRPRDPRRLAEDSRRYFDEARAVSERAHRRGGKTEVREQREPGLPGYYHQNFHFQSGGWLSEGSANVYDTPVEALFTGAADTMRRRALPFIAREVARLEEEGRREEDLVFADIGCGTGRLLAEVADNFPKMNLTAIDLSRHYLAQARRGLPSRARARFVKAAAEKLPLADGSVDILATVYLFHELPPKIRKQAAAEIARVLRPGGLYLHLDSVQYGDTGLDILVESFPRAVHEPYYDGYCKESLPQLFGEAGLSQTGSKIAFLTKISAFTKS